MSQTVDLGYVRGATGEKGDTGPVGPTGPQGPTGPSIEQDVLNDPLVSDLGDGRHVRQSSTSDICYVESEVCLFTFKTLGFEIVNLSGRVQSYGNLFWSKYKDYLKVFVSLNKYSSDPVIIHVQTSVYNEDLTVNISYECIDGTVGSTPEVPCTSEFIPFTVDVSTDTVFHIEQTITL